MYLISYDITSDRLRVKAAKLIIQYGLLRVQYSVFMGDPADRAYKKLNAELQKLKQSDSWEETDNIMILPLHQYSEDFIEFIGSEPFRWSEITGEIHTLVL